MANKSQKIIRNDMLKVLNNLDNRWQEKASLRIVNNIMAILDNSLKFNYKNNPVLIWDYYNTEKFCKGIPNLNELSKKIKLLYFSENMTGADGNSYLEFYRDDENDHLSAVKFLADSYSELVLVLPSLAIDTFGNRLGFGGNSYNLFLHSLKQLKVHIIGVCWSMQLLECFSERSEDLMVDFICTEESHSKSVHGI